MSRNVSKRAYFEIMRVIACGLVIFNHLPGYMLYSISSGRKQFFYMCLTMITRINAPLFFMISGALLFQKNEDFILVIKKRFSRIVGLLLLFDIILIAIQKYLSVTTGTEFSMTIKDFILRVLNNTIPGSGAAYWYLYSYLGVLFVLPFLQRIAKGLTRTELISLIFLHFITSSLIPLINIYMTQCGKPFFLSICEDFSVPFAFAKPFFYTLVGYYLEYKIDMKKIRPKHICLLVLSATIGIILSNICTYTDAKINGVYSQNYVQLFDYLTTIVAFILIISLSGLMLKLLSRQLVCYLSIKT